MSDLERRLLAVESHIAIGQTLTRYCRALDWLDEELLHTCYTDNAFINYGFYKGDVAGFYPVVMEIERAALHRSHFLANEAIEIQGDEAEVECYGIATSTLDGKNLMVFGGRYHNSFRHTAQGWRMSRSEFILDYNYTTEMPDLGDAMGELQSGMGLNATSPLFRKLHR